MDIGWLMAAVSKGGKVHCKARIRARRALCPREICKSPFPLPDENGRPDQAPCMHTAQHPPCGTAGSINVMAQIGRLVPSLRPTGIRNAPSAHGVLRSILPVAMSQELVDWGRQIVATQSVRWADQHLPGIAWVHDAWQLGRAVADARRGDVIQAVCGVPGTLALSAVAEALTEASPRSREACAAQQATVLLMAAVVWATQPQEHERRAPLSLPQRAVLVSLRGIRMLSGVLDALHHRSPSAAQDACASGACIAATPGSPSALMADDQAAVLAAFGSHPPDRIPLGGFGMLPLVSARRAGGRGRPARPAKPKAAARPARPRQRTGIKISRSRKRDPAAAADDVASGLPARREGSAFQIRGAAGNNGAMAGHAQAANADGARESMTGPLSHSSSAVFKAPDLEDRRREGVTHSTPAPPTQATIRARPGSATSHTASPAPAETRAVDPPAVAAPQCLRFHDARQTSSQLRAQRGQSALARYCIHPGARERFTNTFRFPGAVLPGTGALTIAHPIRERIPKALRTSAIQILRHPMHAGSAHPPLPTVIGHHEVYAVVTVALLDGSTGTTLADHPMSLLRNTFRLMEHVDIGGTRHLFVAYLVANDPSGTPGVAAGVLDVEVDADGGVSVRDARRDWTIAAPDLEGLMDVLQYVSGLKYDPGPASRHADHPDAPRPIVPEPAGNLWVCEEEQLSWTPPHDRLPYDRTLGCTNPVAIPRTAYHPALELYANTFTISGESLVYADGGRVTGVLRLGCPTRQGGARILDCPTPADTAFASRFGLQAGYVYDLDALAAQLEAGGMLRVPDPDIVAGAARGTEATPAAGELDTLPASLARCAACFSFNEGVLHYVDPHGKRGTVQFDRTLEQQERYVLGDIERAEDRAFAFGNGFDRLSRYTEVEIVQWLVGEAYERVAVAGTQEREG
ncbi:MAG: hypothetical protein JHC82_02610 [Stenotrophomonas sp.]|nr:hypothetical protein [Stenotrophomonas sp.]